MKTYVHPIIEQLQQQWVEAVVTYCQGAISVHCSFKNVFSSLMFAGVYLYRALLGYNYSN